MPDALSIVLMSPGIQGEHTLTTTEQALESLDLTFSQPHERQSHSKPVTASGQAHAVQHYTLKTLNLITEWMDRAWINPDTQVSKWKDSIHLREAREVDLSTHIERNEGARLLPKELIQSAASDEVLSEDQIFSLLGQTLRDSVNPWTRRFIDKLYTAPTTLSPALELFMGALNASATVSSSAPALCLAEEQTVERLARVLGWDSNKVDGLTMPGGSASNVLALQTALGNAFPSFKSSGMFGVASDLVTMHSRTGTAARPLLLTSEQSHYSLEKAALACGMGLNSVVKIKCDDKGRMDVADLRRVLQETATNLDGTRPDMLTGFPFFINATAGTTILGAFDNVTAIVSTCRTFEYRGPQDSEVSTIGSHPIWIHVDGSWGGPVMFSATYSHLLAGVSEVDSMTFNPHKILNITQQCSFALFRNGQSLGVNVTGAKYLFHGSDDGQPSRDFLRRNPGAKTMGCGRRADGFKFYIEWLRVGTTGFDAHLSRGISHAQRLIQLLEDHYSESLELSLATPSSPFLQVCVRPRISSFIRAKLDATLARGAEERHTTVTNLRYKLISHGTHTVHATLRASGKYQVDKAPVHYPEGCGYYIRIVTHPDVPFKVLKGLVDEVDTIGKAFFDQIRVMLTKDSESEQFLWQLISCVDT